MGVNCPFVLVLLAFASRFSFTEADIKGTFQGRCYYNYGLNATTCSEVYKACGNSSSCITNDEEIGFYCDNLGCSGSWMQDTIDVCQSLRFGTCEEADAALVSVGCVCSDCVAGTTYIDAECYYPFNCSAQASIDFEPSANFGVPISVYSLVASTLVVNVLMIALCCRPKRTGQLSTREVVRKKLPCVESGIYRLALASFVLDDGSPMPFLDFVCDKRDLFGVIDCRRMRTNMRPRWMRLGAFVTTFLVTLSLAFIFGTYVYNHEICTYAQDTCDGVAMIVSCIDTSSDFALIAYGMTTLISLVVSKGSVLALNFVAIGSIRQKLQLAAAFLTAIGLVIFGVIYSNTLSKGEIDGDVGGESRRQGDIKLTLLVGWGVGELVGLVLALLRFLLCKVCYYLVFESQLEQEKEKSAGAAAIYPQEGPMINDAIIESGPADSVNSPKSIIQTAVGEMPINSSVKVTIGKKSTVAPNKNVLTENMKLEPPTRSEQQ